jgi:hypothetical protein
MKYHTIQKDRRTHKQDKVFKKMLESTRYTNTKETSDAIHPCLKDNIPWHIRRVIERNIGNNRLRRIRIFVGSEHFQIC